MATLRKIVQSNPISQFQQVAPEAGGLFRSLAVLADSAYERLRPAAIEEQRALGEEEGREWARRQIGDPLAGTTDTFSLIREFEGFRDTPYWDVNALRTGYGSDTITLADGTVRRVQSGDKVSREGADRDLQRRVKGEFEPMVARAIGTDAFLSMTPSQRAAVTSIAYNYGEVPDRIAGALRSGDADAAAAAIRGLAGDNGGVNARRRNREAEVFLSGGQPTVLRTSEGKLEPRLYSPLAGEILQAHDAAAGVAYASEVMLKGVTDMMGMSEQYALDPSGFRSAATSYVDELVKGAPERFRSDVRASLEKEMQRRFLGVLEDQQRDTRQRADNASAALIDKWGANYSEALASGNLDEAASAKAELDSLLMARERLPGLSWTPEQSANVITEAQKGADRIRATAAKQVVDGHKTTLETIIASAKEGLHAGAEAILDDPTVQAMLPDLWKQAAGAVALRDWLPSFRSAPPAEMAAAIAQMRSEPITDELELATIKAAEDAYKASAEAWVTDPIAQAGSVLDDKPPELPAIEGGNPETIVKGLAARRDYGNALVAQGYVAAPSFLSEKEAETIGALMGKDADPVMKAALAGAIVQGFGPDATRVFQEINSNDPVTRYAGMMLAQGGSQAIATEAMRGQQMLDEGLVQAPSKGDKIASVSMDIASALSALPNSAVLEGDLMAYATAIYAGQARGVDPTSENAATLMEQSVQVALGQSQDKRGRVTGGVQEIGGHSVLLPVGIAGEDVDAAMQAGLTQASELWFVTPFGVPMGTEAAPPSADVFGGKTPMIAGEPVTTVMWGKGNLRIVPAGRTTYRMEVVVDGVSRGSVQDQDGGIFTFDLGASIGALP